MVNRPINKTPLRTSGKGLTLVELLVAISVLGFVAVLGWRGLDSIVRARVALTSDLEQTRGMQLAFAQLHSDCAHLAAPSSLPNRAPLAIGPERLTLVRTVYADNQPSRLQVIAYRSENGVLVRYESAATRDLRELDRLWLSAASDTDTNKSPFDRLGSGVVLQSDVTALKMRVWLSGSNSWQSQLNLQTPASGSTANSALPAGLEVTMRLRGDDTGVLKIFLLGAL